MLQEHILQVQMQQVAPRAQSHILIRTLQIYLRVPQIVAAILARQVISQAAPQVKLHKTNVKHIVAQEHTFPALTLLAQHALLGTHVMLHM